MKADHFEQQKLLDLAAEDVALTQLAHRGRTLPEVAAVEAAEEAERTFSADVVRAETEARDLATTLVAAVEGGFMLSRAARSPEPMRTSGRAMRRLAEAALDAERVTPGRRRGASPAG